MGKGTMDLCSSYRKSARGGQTSLRGISSRAAKDKEHRFGPPGGGLDENFLTGVSGNSKEMPRRESIGWIFMSTGRIWTKTSRISSSVFAADSKMAEGRYFGYQW
jgi:hypothetical protein